MDRKIAADYDKLSGVLGPMGIKIEGLIRDLVSSVGLTIVSVNHRVKSNVSATKKIDGSSGKYGTYGDLHDMLGVRVVTYLASDVDTVVDVLRANFDVDEERSLDKLTGLDPDRFGYLSYHLVAKLDDVRAGFAEWAPYRDVYFEIQIRSILQHAWAEIEHDLGYKSTSGIPAQLKRRFARLAGLLETADSEFDAVSREVADHVERVREAIDQGGDVPVDRDSILALVLTDGGIVGRADRAIAAGIGATIAPATGSYADSRADELTGVGFTSTGQVASALAAEETQLVDFAVKWFLDDAAQDGQEPFPYTTLPAGVSLFYLYLHRTLQQEGGEWSLELGGMDDPQTREIFKHIHDSAFQTRPVRSRRRGDS
ncbi:hypothetical protein IFU08_08100 [Microbacterium sp. CFBP 8790]|uniref:hypothetical protein n=1 Tax=unclassified Microbacterium TaxID=2609290 RepID=UPI00177B8F3B|nr:hypothetical protein [Microbacterium sp. CFBP 8801]MBD8509532.1 hypothetical protein [Microbacterium sp. CFBP 8790]